MLSSLNKQEEKARKHCLSVTFRYSVGVGQLDAIFLEKFFERIEALEKLDDWEDKLAERLAGKEESQEYQRRLIHKQIQDAQARWKELFDALHDPELPKTKQMKIEYTNQMAGLEGKIAEWEGALETPDAESEGEDEEITLYQIHSLLPDIASKWDELPFALRLRFVGALVRKVVLSRVAPVWLKIEVYWKGAVGNIVDRGHFKRKLANKTRWSQEEEALLRELYPAADAVEVLKALPDRSWDGIQHRANRLNIGRERKGPNSIYVTLESYGTLEDRKYEEEHGLSPFEKKGQWL